MKIRHYIIIPFVILMLIFGLGSFSKGHLDNISIVTCLEIRKLSGDLYTVRAEIADTVGSAESGTSQSNILSANGPSIGEAFLQLSRLDSSSIYTGHVRLILYDLAAAREDGFEELSEFILDTKDIRFNVPVALYDADSGDILEAETLITGNKGLDLERGIRNAVSEKTNVSSEAFQVINSVGDEDYRLSLPVISIHETGDKTVAYIDDTAVFYGGEFQRRGGIDSHDSR